MEYYSPLTDIYTTKYEMILQDDEEYTKVLSLREKVYDVVMLKALIVEMGKYFLIKI